MPKRKNQ